MWLACGLGRRNFRNILRLFRDVLCRTDPQDTVLITTDGFAPYGWVVPRVYGHACVYGQVIKTRRNNRIVRVETTGRPLAVLVVLEYRRLFRPVLQLAA